MAIIKFVNDPADFTVNTGSESTLSPYFTDTRVRGWVFGYTDAMVFDFPQEPGTDLWMHFTIGYSNSSILWQETDHLRIEDFNGTLVASSDIQPGFIDWNFFADTTSSITYRTIADARLIMDLHFVRNGTTDISMTVYVNGTFQGTMTGANSANKGLPTNLSMTNLDSTSGNGTLYWGECVIANEDTRGWRMYQLRPTAFGVNQQWVGDATSVVDGSLLTGISTDVLNGRTSFGLSRIEYIADTALIDRIAVQTYGQRGASGLTSFNHYFRYEGGTIVDDADIVLGLTADMYIDEYTTNPNTAGAWAAADIQGLQLGVRART
jgi:hypothetical protein